MRTLFTAFIAFVAPFSAFAGFNVNGTNETEFVYTATKSTFLKINGHTVQLGKGVPDAYGNFTDQEIMTLTLMLMDPLNEIPHGTELRKRHESFFVQVVKGATFNVERRADRGFLRVPAMTLVTITIPATASPREVGKFLAKFVTLRAAHTDSASSMTRDLVEPQPLNGCEMHLYQQLAGPV